MSDSDNSPFAGFGKFVPGFDFLQNLATQAAGSAAPKIPQMPNLGNWVAPTINVEELDKRIDELKAVQFWLDQNAMALKATIQALEVQKMTLATLKGMNFSMGDMANAFKLKVSDSLAGGMQRATEKASKTFSGLEVPPTTFGVDKTDNAADRKSADAADDSADAASDDASSNDDEKPENAARKGTASSGAGRAGAGGGVVDPMQWWGALTQQFQTIAADAMKEAAKKTAMDPTKNVAAGMAKDAMKSATDMATGIARGMADSASKVASGGARAAMSNALRSSQAWPTPGSVKTAAAGKTAAKASPAPRSSAKAATKTASRSAAKTASKTARKSSR